MFTRFDTIRDRTPSDKHRTTAEACNLESVSWTGTLPTVNRFFPLVGPIIAPLFNKIFCSNPAYRQALSIIHCVPKTCDHVFDDKLN